MAASMDPNAFTTPFQLTKSLHRDVYATIEPTKLYHLAEGKVIFIAGASGGLGFVSFLINFSL
jgi:hypothetical protein